MNKIINPRIVALNNSEVVAERDFAVDFLFLQEQRALRFVLKFDDVVNALDGSGEMVSKEGVTIANSDLCNPGGHTDFGWLVSIVLNAAVCSGRITREEYFKLVRRHFEDYYLQVYYSKSKMCADFYARYFSHRIKKRVNGYEQLFKRFAKEINEKGRKVWLQRGGNFAGCFFDDDGILHPRTSPKYYETLVPIAEQLWVCFTECCDY